MADVFISYARADWDHAKRLADELSARGYQVWWDVELVGSDNFRDVIMAELEVGKAVIVIWSAASCCSNFVLDEAGRALKANKLVATRLEGFDPANLPLGFGAQHTELVTRIERITPALIKLGIDTTAKKSAAEQARLLSEHAFWDEISSSEDPQDFKLYLAEYPDGLHRASAKLRLRKLGANQPGLLQGAASLFSQSRKQSQPAQTTGIADIVATTTRATLPPKSSPFFIVLAIIFLLTILPILFVLAELFDSRSWNFLGSTINGERISGILVGLGLIVLLAMLIMRVRGTALGAAERAIYWLGLIFSSATIVLFIDEIFLLTGYSMHFSVGLVVLSGWLNIRSQGATLSIAERAIYWLGSAFAIAFSLGKLFGGFYWSTTAIGISTNAWLVFLPMIAVSLYLWLRPLRR